MRSTSWDRNTYIACTTCFYFLDNLDWNKISHFLLADYSESTSKSSEPTTVETALNTEIRLIDSQQNADNLDDKVTDASLAQSIEQKPLKSEERIKEGVSSWFCIYSLLLLLFSNVVL